MAKIPALAILVLQLFCMLLEVSGKLPCYRYFEYTTDPSTGGPMGQIQIPSPPKNMHLRLRVVLHVPVAPPTVNTQSSNGRCVTSKQLLRTPGCNTEYASRLVLAQSEKLSIQRIQQGKPLLYHIYFPLQQTTPILDKIWLNQQLYCQKNISAMGPAWTPITLSHNLLYQTHMAPHSQNPHPNVLVNPRPPFPMSQPDSTETTKRPILQHPICSVSSIDIYNQTSPIMDDSKDCGCSIYMNNVNRRISEGKKVWPWVADLFVIRFKFEHLCVGSILTNRHVLIAAHCCKLKGANIPPNLMLVSLGQSHSRTLKEKGSVYRKVGNYSLHPDYVFRNSSDSDLALLVLRNPVEFSPTISPVCLWSSPDALQSFVSKSGYVMRWVKDKINFAVTRIMEIPLVSQEDCLRSNPNFVGITSNRTFCAGSRDGTGPRNSDSGLVLLNATTGRYQLRGIVSLSQLGANIGCGLNQYVVFVDVAKYVQWIKQQISIM